MGNYDFEGQSDGDWDDKGNISWNEFDWQQFLQRQQKDIARFVALYDQFHQEPNHLDRIALEMGWDQDDWSVSDGLDDFDDDSDEDNRNDSDPYTIHRHPVFVVSTGLLAQMRYIWEICLHRSTEPTSAVLSWKYANNLGNAERNLVLLIQSIDMGDYLLGVCHGKFALRSINDTMGLLSELSDQIPDGQKFLEAMRKRLFDLREVTLRIMQDCRDESQRGFRDND